MGPKILIITLLIIKLVFSYLQVQLSLKRDKNYISYGLPIKISNLDYVLSISLQNNKQYFTPIAEKTSDRKKKKHHSEEQVQGVLRGYSIQGYTYEGWIRFFQQAVLFIQSRYQHQIVINLDQVQQLSSQNLNNRDGVINFGPDLQKNLIFKLIKANNDYIKQNVISIYRKVNDKNVKLQLGGFQNTYAKGHHDGYLFYSLQLIERDSKWKFATSFISVKRPGSSGKQQIFRISNSGATYRISLESPMVKIPLRLAIDIERALQTPHSTCKIQKNRLACENIPSTDLIFTYIQFCINEGAYINISLYDLVEHKDDDNNQTLFNLQFTQDPSQFQIGQALFKSYYVSIDMTNKKMTYSPINHFPNPNYGIYLIRFLIGSFLFLVVGAVFALMWQMCSDIQKRNKIVYGSKGIQVQSYQRPGQSQTFD